MSFNASVITSQFFPFPQGVYQYGGVATVHTDGSQATAVTFPFVNQVLNAPVVLTINSVDGVDRELSVQYKDLALTGMNIWCYGGLPGETVTITWAVYGA
jgi:hypothetical protein